MQNGRWAPACKSGVLSVATGAGRSRLLDKGALGVLSVMSDRPVATAGGFAICRICQLRGTPVTLRVSLARWRCQNHSCERRTFSDRLPHIARSFARKTCRVADLTTLFGHAVGGRPAERLMASLGLPQSDDTILRSLKRHAGARERAATVRVVGIDDWAWQKGLRYGTIMVDLERREVVDVVPDRSAEATGQCWVNILVLRSSDGIAAVSTRPRFEAAASLAGRPGDAGCRRRCRWRHAWTRSAGPSLAT